MGAAKVHEDIALDHTDKAIELIGEHTSTDDDKGEEAEDDRDDI